MISCLFFLGFSSMGSAAAVNVAILPFQMNADTDLEYINTGIRHMLASRLVYGTDITVVEHNLLNDALTQAKIGPGELTEKGILQIGNTLGTDYVIFGSITRIGVNMSLDVYVLNVLQGGKTGPVFTQTGVFDELIPQIDGLAQRIKDAVSRDLGAPISATGEDLPGKQFKTAEALTAKIKEELKREILAELRNEGMLKTDMQSSTLADREQLKEELTRDILVKLRKQDAADGSVQPIKDGGSAEGRMLRGGKGLAECRVKLVRMVTAGLFSEMFQNFKEGTEFETLTDEKGKYYFANLPKGAYKLKWELPGDRGWIRRLRDKPDATIENGKKSVLFDVETNRKLVPR